MEANEFIAKLKATGADSDVIDLSRVHEDSKTILSKLTSKDKGSFALNVLCILCRNLDKVPTWCACIDNKALLSLSIDCVRETRAMGTADRVKTLACVFHIHRYVVRQASSLPPEMVLKLSYMPFECTDSNIITEYSKTYWNILADRLLYVEKLKKKPVIIKLLTKLTEDIQTVIKIYDTVQFCSKVLAFLVKKMHTLYNDYYSEPLNKAFEKIFECLMGKNDLENLKSLKDNDAMDLYVTLNECFYVVAENASKLHFKDSALNKAVKTAFMLLGHKSDFFHCLSAFYLNSICNLLSENVNFNFTETILNSVLTSCETTEKLGYKQVMQATYPYLYQMIRLYIEFTVNNSDKKKWNQYFNIQTQENCLKLMLLLMKKLRNTDQLLKCENCNVKAGVHDSLRLSFTVKHFLLVSLAQEMDVATILPLFLEITQEQHSVLTELSKLGCHNHGKCLSKVQTDIHNSAILLNKYKYYEYSIKTFNMYLTNEIRILKTQSDTKNLSRGFYNKSICELDDLQYEEGLKSAFLSLLFSQSEGMKSGKHVSLVIDIKAKVLKSKTSDNPETDANQTDLQLMTVLDICEMAAKSDCYENLNLLFADSKMSALLRHEYSVYARLWPSVVPIAGVWKALDALIENKHADWLNAEDEKQLNQTLYEIVLDTPNVVRTIHNQHFTEIIGKLLRRFAEKSTLTAEDTLVYSICLFYRCEYNLADASVKYDWKLNEGVDLEQLPVNRTIPQEHKALCEGVKAVELLTSILPDFKTLAESLCRASLHMCEVFVHQLLLLARDAHALQLARICCALGDAVGDTEAYLRNAGVILHQASSSSEQVEAMLANGCRYVRERDRYDETALVFTCQAAMFLSRRGVTGAAAKLLQTAQSRILAASEERPDIKLELATGALLEAGSELCYNEPGPGALAAVIDTQKHYMGITQKGSHRRLRSATVRYLQTRSCLRCTLACAQPRLYRRAQAAAAAAAAARSGAALLARAVAAVTWPDVTSDAEVKIDDRIKYILGLQPTNETQPEIDTKPLATHTKAHQLETMLDSQLYRTRASPSVPCAAVPRFKVPEFLTHDAPCRCYACDTPVSFVLALRSASLEAAVYAKSREFDIARHYYEGALNTSANVKTKLTDATRMYKELGFDSCVVDIVGEMYQHEFQQALIQTLIDASYFELALGNYVKADDFVVTIHEIMEDSRSDVYVKSDVLNLICASARLREVRKPIVIETGLESEMDSLRLSPQPKVLQPPTTPEMKAEKPPQFDSKTVSEDEVPKAKRKVIKLNLDEVDERPLPKPRTRREFKIPVPSTAKPVIEAPTPVTRRTKPTVVVTADTPQTKRTERPKATERFFTPKEDPLEEVFFTPMTSVKTDTQKSLRENLVKNLEKEFVDRPKTLQVAKVKPKAAETGSASGVREKRLLRRATSPGALEGARPNTSPGASEGARRKTAANPKRQLRQPTKYRLGDEKK